MPQKIKATASIAFALDVRWYEKLYPSALEWRTLLVPHQWLVKVPILELSIELVSRKNHL